MNLRNLPPIPPIPPRPAPRPEDIDATSGPVTITLPALPAIGTKLIFRKGDPSPNPVDIQTPSGVHRLFLDQQEIHLVYGEVDENGEMVGHWFRLAESS